jgi:hypothetical protein
MRAWRMFVFYLGGGQTVSISSISAQSHLQRNAAAWLGAKVVLVLVAIVLFCLAAVVLEVRAGIVDTAITMDLS